jgi:hypothetical protein
LRGQGSECLAAASTRCGGWAWSGIFGYKLLDTSFILGENTLGEKGDITGRGGVIIDNMAKTPLDTHFCGSYTGLIDVRETLASANRRVDSRFL